MWIKRDIYDAFMQKVAQVEFCEVNLDELKAEIQRLRVELAAERARSDSAVDRLLEQKGVGPVTPVKAPTLEDLSSMFEEDPAEVTAIRHAIKEQGAAAVLMSTDSTRTE